MYYHMNIEILKHIISLSESGSVEFKRSTGQLERGMETLCAFLNGDARWSADKCGIRIVCEVWERGLSSVPFADGSVCRKNERGVYR